MGLLVEWANRIPDLSRIWIPALIREVRPFQDALAFITLWRVFRRDRPQVVHTHSSKAGILGRWAAHFAGVPFIFHTAHGFGFNDFQRPAVRNFYLWLGEGDNPKITTKLVVVSYANAEKGEKSSGVFQTRPMDSRAAMRSPWTNSCGLAHGGPGWPNGRFRTTK